MCTVSLRGQDRIEWLRSIHHHPFHPEMVLVLCRLSAAPTAAWVLARVERRGHGKDARTLVQVDASLEGRIKAAVSRGLGLVLDADARSAALTSKATEEAPPVPTPTAALPARVAVGGNSNSRRRRRRRRASHRA